MSIPPHTDEPSPKDFLPAIRQDVLTDAESRRARLKARIQASQRPISVAPPMPKTAEEARESALTLIDGLRRALTDSQNENAALKHELEEAKADQFRAVSEAKLRREESIRLTKELSERTSLIQDLGQELSGLEGERDALLVALNGAKNAVETARIACSELERRVAMAEQSLKEANQARRLLEAEITSQNQSIEEAAASILAITGERDSLAEKVESLEKEVAVLRQSRQALDDVRQALTR